MDVATSAALRAILAGLRTSGVISSPHVEVVVRELETADLEIGRYGDAHRYEIRRLCIQLAEDAGVETAITSVEPPSDWGH